MTPNSAHPDHDPALELLTFLSAEPLPLAMIATEMDMPPRAVLKLFWTLHDRGFRVERANVKYLGDKKTCVWIHANGMANATAAAEAYLSRVEE